MLRRRKRLVGEDEKQIVVMVVLEVVENGVQAGPRLGLLSVRVLLSVRD